MIEIRVGERDSQLHRSDYGQFCRARRAEAEKLCDMLGEQVNSGQDGLLPALYEAQDRRLHWRKLAAAVEAEEAADAERTA